MAIYSEIQIHGGADQFLAESSALPAAGPMSNFSISLEAYSEERVLAEGVRGFTCADVAMAGYTDASPALTATQLQAAGPLRDHHVRGNMLVMPVSAVRPLTERFEGQSDRIERLLRWGEYSPSPVEWLLRAITKPDEFNRSPSPLPEPDVRMYDSVIAYKSSRNRQHLLVTYASQYGGRPAHLLVPDTQDYVVQRPPKTKK